MSDDKNTVKDNNIIEIIEPVKVDGLETTIEIEEIEENMPDEEIVSFIEEGSEQVPLDPMLLPDEFILQLEGFAKGLENVAELAGEISLLASVGVTPQLYIQLKYQHEEQLAAMEMNKEIAKMNVEASKNIKKDIDIKSEDGSL